MNNLAIINGSVFTSFASKIPGFVRLVIWDKEPICMKEWKEIVKNKSSYGHTINELLKMYLMLETYRRNIKARLHKKGQVN